MNATQDINIWNVSIDNYIVYKKKNYNYLSGGSYL